MNRPFTVPRDRYHIIYLIMLLHGIGLLLPWNMFITAKSYFIDYKLHKNYTNDDTPYGQYFMSYIGFASQVPNVIVNWLNIFIQPRYSVKTRIMWSIVIQICVFVFTIILVIADSSGWPRIFLFLTILAVVILNMANAIYQNSLFGLVAKLPPKFIGAIVLGNNISGTFVAVVCIISEVLLPNKRTSAVYYFHTGFVLLVLCLNSLFVLPINKFYRHYDLKHKRELEETKSDGNKPEDLEVCQIPYRYIYKKASPQLFNIFLTMFISLAIFPALQSYIQPVDPNFFIPPNLFTSITCFLTYNFCTMIGSLMVTFFQWPKPNYVWIPVILRIIFVPIFIFCNYQPLGIQRTLPVLINNDWIYWGLTALNGFSSGYLTSLTMIYIPGTVDDIYADVANMFGSAMLMTGVLFGILFSFLGPWFVNFLSSLNETMVEIELLPNNDVTAHEVFDGNLVVSTMKNLMEIFD